MILATVEGHYGRQRHMAILAKEGWSFPASTAVGQLLNNLASPSLFGPADGDPVARAAFAASTILGGRVVFVRTLSPDPPSASY